MKTLEELKARCHLAESGCWEIDSAASSSVWSFDHNYGDMRTMRPRRAAWFMRHKKPMPAGHRVYVTCGNEQCCNPDHVTNRSTASEGARVRRTGEMKGRVRKVLANRAIGRKRSKLTPEVIELIQTSPKPGYVLARELGMSPTTVSKGRRGLSVAAPASPWAGMGAR